ncbi:rRNA adenine N(6)-methyltransferase [Caerostris darwini]|uniref:rRNA adenine N(6)-methyltransferase n=1 Tax=Caerostris darwini TaxID=1538125 RepID=A0AAV4TKK6_9ARAC|nr:rRNA adenine N(6)-methyltransferase [Caerostris darwini]
MFCRNLYSSRFFFQSFSSLSCVHFHRGKYLNFIRYASGKHLKSSKSTKKKPYNEFAKKNHFKAYGNSYINDSASADIIASHLCEDWKEGYIFECNPGPGMLSESILKLKIPHLRVFEKNEKFLPQLKVLSTEYDNFEIVEKDFLFLPNLTAKRLYHDTCDDLDEFFNGIPKIPWENGVPFRLFSIIHSSHSIKFSRYLLAGLANKAFIFSHGRCEFFFFMKQSEYLSMFAEPKSNFKMYRWSTVLYKVFFDIKFLYKDEENSFYLVKLTPRSDLFSSLVNDNRLQDFYYFIWHHFFRRTDFVIPVLEKYVPLCGTRLIEEGMNAFVRFGYLSPEQLLRLFNQFSSWPEYEESIFHFTAKSFFKEFTFVDEEEEEEESDFMLNHQIK